MLQADDDMIAKLEAEEAEADVAFNEAKKAEKTEPEDTVRIDEPADETFVLKTAESGNQVTDEEIKPPEEPVEKQKKLGRPPKKKVDGKEPFEQQYKVMQGINRKQADQISEQQDEIGELKNMVVEIQKQLQVKEVETTKPVSEDLKPVAPEIEKTQLEPQKYLTDDDKAAYGDTIDIIRKASREVVENELSQYDQELQKRLSASFAPLSLGSDIESVRGSQAKTEQDIFMDKLRLRTPYADEIVDLYNKNDKHFSNWLDEPMSDTPFTKRDSFDRYNTKFDAKGIAKLFNDYAKEVSVVEQPENLQTETSLPSSDQVTLPSSKPIDRIVSPDHIRSESSPNIEAEKPIRRYSELSDALILVRKDLMTPDDYEKLQAEIDIAIHEGRIVP